MEFDVFNEILSAAESIDKSITSLETILGVQAEGGPLLASISKLLDLLIRKLIYDDGTVTMNHNPICNYIYEDNWGKNPRIYSIENNVYVVNDSESLYKYLVAKYDYECKKEYND